MSIPEAQQQRLKELFPEVFTEGGKVDWDRLRLTLGEQVDVGKERFGMNWPGKADCFKTIQQPSIATLAPAREESIDFDTTQNLFIEGDNLEVLKLLQKSYLGKIKMIYIDPPYNTGNDFIYPDNYSENLQTYLEYTGQVDGEGRKFNTNAETDGRFHSKWMNMMYPRLFLSKNLMKEDGLVFISINDGEVNNLRMICNEIFGEECFVTALIWKSRQNVDSRAQSGVSIDHEYIVIYCKSISRLKGKEIDKNKYSNPDNDTRGPWMSNNMLGLATRAQRPNLHYDLTDPETGIMYSCPESSGWRYSKEAMDQKIKDKRIIFPKKIDGRPREKIFLNELSSTQTNFSSLLDEDLVGHTLNGTREVRDILGENIFSFPKPVSLLKVLVEQGSAEDDIVLDFFAGSSTIAHAVIKLNLENQQRRRFICVQLPEPIETGQSSNKDFKTISDVSKERIRRVIAHVRKEQNEKQTEAKKTLFGTDLKDIDLGFKVFKLNQSNFNLWKTDTEKSAESIIKQLELNISHISRDASQEAILFELLLKSGFELTTLVSKEAIAGKSVFSVAEGELFVCLEKELTLELIKGIAEKRPSRVICLDQGFQNNDQLKTNAVQIMKSKGVIKFQTV
ncbi:MAG: site-specific DNA-methyltransferase [Cyclobacteriaceae bacterium]|nr:site-specific DNA-methyltransferase [Cyclobacteriaceae bacterium]